jgi:hypothetical protein
MHDQLLTQSSWPAHEVRQTVTHAALDAVQVIIARNSYCAQLQFPLWRSWKIRATVFTVLDGIA